MTNTPEPQESGELEKIIESAVVELGKESTAPDKECPTWMESDIRRGIKRGIEIERDRLRDEVMKVISDYDHDDVIGLRLEQLFNEQK